MPFAISFIFMMLLYSSLDMLYYDIIFFILVTYHKMHIAVGNSFVRHVFGK